VPQPPHTQIADPRAFPYDEMSVRVFLADHPAAPEVVDPKRVAALGRTALLDSPPEEAFDRLTELARRALGVPVALVTLVDDCRQFFKSASGLAEPWASARETPLSHSFCQHVVARGRAFVVSDARVDPIVIDNLAVPDLGVIAYAGVPITLPSGHVIGAFAAIDTVPREWTAADIKTLNALAAAVVTEAELRGVVAEAREQTRAARSAEQRMRVSESRLRDLCDIMADATMSFEDKIDRILTMGCRQFGLSIGMLGETDVDLGSGAPSYTVTRSYATQGDTAPPVGFRCRLEETFCREVLAHGDAVSWERLPDDVRERCPVAVAGIGGETYIGSPISVSGAGFDGSLCFSARFPRSEPFTAADREFVRVMAQWIGSEAVRQRSEAALQDSREQYELAIHGSKDGIWDWHIAEDRVSYSPRWKAMLGYTPEEFRDEAGSWHSLIHDEDRPRVLAVLDDHLSGRTAEYEVEYRVRHRDGGHRWIRARGIVLRDENGVPYRMAGSHSDITERRQAEEALRESEAGLAEAQAVAQLGNWEADLVTGRVRLSAQMYLLYGMDANAVSASPLQAIKERLEPGDWAQILASAARCARTGKTQDLDHIVVLPGDVGLRNMHARIQARRGQDGRISHLFGTVMDVTERRRKEADRQLLVEMTEDARGRAEAARAQAETTLLLVQDQAVELERARDEAVQHARAKSEFLANMSHEVRTPMNGVIGMTDLLLDTPLDSSQREFAESIRSSGIALLTVINDILDFSKIESGKLELEDADFDVRALVEETVALLAPTAHTKGLEFTCRVLPADRTAVLHGDGNRIRQVLTNLLGNALKFTHHGQIGVEAVIAEVGSGKANLRLAVSDTGIGIPPDRQQAIFESFVQADGSTTRRYGGTGLGLTITRQLVELMGGRIAVESVPGVGSVFTVEVRLAIGDPRLAAETVSADGLAGSRVLVVDDNAMNRRILHEQLSAWGCRVDTADSGVIALDRLADARTTGDPYALGLFDLHMPDMDGIETARRARAVAPSSRATPLLLLSSGMGSHSATTSEAGALFAAVLSKPLRQASLLAAMHRALVRVPAQGSARATSDAPVRDDDRRGRHVAPSVGRDLDGLRVLVAEDNLVNQKIATHLLARWGCEVTVVGDGRAAIAAMQAAGPFDVVLMDVQMPELDGMAATDVLRRSDARAADGRRLPVVALTAHSMQGDRERCIEAGMDDYLSKPLREADLKEVLIRWRPAPAERAGDIELTDAHPGKVALEPDAPDASLPVLNRKHLWECCGEDAELVSEVIQEFLMDVPGSIARLGAAVTAETAASIRFEAHSLRGACRTIGADALESILGDMEERAAHGDLTDASALMTRAAQYSEVLASTLRAVAAAA
jgi:PAS domain S-box-containing protein